MMVRSVVVLPAPLRLKQDGHGTGRNGKIDALQYVVLTDVGVHARQR